MVKKGMVTAINGKDIDIEAQSIFVHGDNPQAVEFVRKIRSKLQEEEVQVTAISNFIC